jgi:hypothetical protein
MRGRIIPLITCLILLGGLAAVALGQVGTPSLARAAAVRAAGAFEISNSGDGSPIFAATGIAPGDSVKGKVTIEDPGSVPVALKLQRGELTDAVGAGGMALSGRLQLTVADVTDAEAPRTLYTGPLDSMGDQEAGELKPGASRIYEFVATLPESSSGNQNALQGASTTIAYSWVAEEASAGEEEAPAGGGGGTGTGTGGRTGTGTGAGIETRGAGGESGAAPGGGVAAAAATLDLTVPRISQRLKGGGIVARVDCNATCRIFVRGKLRATAHGHHRTAKIRFSLSRSYTAGSKTMRIPIPRGLRKWLRRMPPPKRLKAKLRFTAVGTAGGRDVVKKKVRLRVRHH